MWIELGYSNKQINNAGRTLLINDKQDEYNNALNIINNWRSAHAFPLNTFQTLLRRYSNKIDNEAIVVQRLKKLESITYKLKRFPDMKLSRMQDIGGCRAIMSDIDLTYKLYKLIRSSRIRHKLINEKDYIKYPKESGYRGIHLIYKYFSERNDRYNGLQIEIQIRSYKQHIWATAVETVGVFIKNSLKSSQGPNEWLRFFALMSSLIAIEENSNCIPNTPCNVNELIKEIKYIVEKNDLLKKLQAFNAAVGYLNTPKFSENDYYILILKYKIRRLTILPFKKKDFENASKMYIEEEKKEKKNGNDVVLVSASSIDNLKQAYPNYFMDTKEFNEILEKYLVN